MPDRAANKDASTPLSFEHSGAEKETVTPHAQPPIRTGVGDVHLKCGRHHVVVVPRTLRPGNAHLLQPLKHAEAVGEGGVGQTVTKLVDRRAGVEAVCAAGVSADQ